MRSKKGWKNRIEFLIGLTLSGIFAFSCERTDVYYSEFYELGKNGLNPEVTYIFSPFDSVAPINKNEIYDIEACLRYTDECLIKSLPLEYEVASLNTDSIFNGKVQIPLFYEDDSSMGKGNFGFYEISSPILTHQKYDPDLQILISTPESNGNGIISIGMILRKVE